MKRFLLFLPLAIVVLLVAGSIGWMAWRLSDWSLPPLARGLSRGSWEDGQRRFTQKLQETYPPGTAEKVLVAELNREGFKTVIHHGDRYSEGTLARFMGCGDKEWRVLWHASNGYVIEIRGLYGANCL